MDKPENAPATPSPENLGVVPVHQETECPKCGHKFFHKIGHAFAKIGEAGLEVVANVLQPGVSR